jgi:hypothetical protein
MDDTLTLNGVAAKAIGRAIQDIEIYARLQTIDDDDGAHSLKVTVGAGRIDMETASGSVSLHPSDFDQVAALVARWRDALALIVSAPGPPEPPGPGEAA